MDMPPTDVQQKPFVIELEQRDRALSGSFTPAASIRITPALRTSGLLRSLPPEAAAWLLFLLTFVSPNGNCSASLDSLCEAMHVSKQKTHKRMDQLRAVEWDGWPLVLETRHETGLVSFSLSERVISYEQHEPPAPTEPTRIGGIREAVIEYSRATYGRPRAEVERLVEAQYGHHELPPLADPELQELQRSLEAISITSEQALRLIGAYDRERIERQLAWLPYRDAKNPAGFLIAAIEHDYDEPLSLRLLRTAGAADGPTDSDIPAHADLPVDGPAPVHSHMHRDADDPEPAIDKAATGV
jgi:hypothetical protein